MFLVYANVSSLESRGLFMRLYTYTDISQMKTAGIVLHFKNLTMIIIFKVCLYSYHVATIPFS